MTTIAPYTRSEINTVKEALLNFPESGICLACVKWNYDTMRFTFMEDKEYGTPPVKHTLWRIYL